MKSAVEAMAIMISSVLVTVPLLFSVAAGFPFLSAVDNQQVGLNGLGSINNFHGLMCQDTNEIECSSLNVESRCETTCSGYRVCFKACPSGAAMPGEQNLLCICRDGLVRNYQGFCVPRQSCFGGSQQHFFGSFGRNFNSGFSNGFSNGFGNGFGGSFGNSFANTFGNRPIDNINKDSLTSVSPRMTSRLETTGFQAESEHQRHTVEPENPFVTEKRVQATKRS